MTKLELTRSDEKATAILKAVRLIDEGAELAPVVHGRWIDIQEDEATEGMWCCSVCGSDRYFDIMTPTEAGCYYCPNCGAKMGGKGERNV